MHKFLLFLLFPVFLFSQEIKISGTIKNIEDRGIESTSVVVFDESYNTLTYTYSHENGNYSLTFKKPDNSKINISVSSLGYKKKEVQIDLEIKNNILQSFILEEQTESLNEVVIELNKKIKINKDTTSIKIASFINQTEQTIEDVLKKLPGIEIQKDGSIKAHGKSISKLLIEGEDLFDQNYKLLSKNLDAKLLDAVEIIDAFEDNPILKKMNNSEKVALNLKLKKDKQNIWFGNATAGSGIVSENRWKEGINIGLLKKRIKLFYLADYNNLGEKASSLITESTINIDFFGEEKIEKTTKKQFLINNNENNTFSQSQSIFNKAFFNSLSFNSKIKPDLTIRGVGYFTNDNQNQNSISQTVYNIDENPIINNEVSQYSDKKSLSSGEIELKHQTNENNYLTNLFVYKNNPNIINSSLLFNNSAIDQSSKISNQTFYNHFNHSYSLSNRTIVTNYIFFGNDGLKERNNLVSPFLNDFLKTNPHTEIKQSNSNKNQYYGIKSKLISSYRNLEYALAFQYENSKESINSDFFVANVFEKNYSNNTNLNQNLITLENTIRYNLSSKIDFTFNLKYTYDKLYINSYSKNLSVYNPNLTFNLKKTNIGNFKLSYSQNSLLPEINFLTTNFQLTDYRTFRKGYAIVDLLKNQTVSLFYTLFNDEKRFSITSNLAYIKSKKILNSEGTITQNFNFENYIITNGGENYNGTFSLVNYFKDLKWTTKLETTQNLNSNPTKVNSQEFNTLKNYNGQYSFSASTYYPFPINFDFGFTYNYYQTTFNSIITSNEIKNAFLNCNYKISKKWLLEANSTFYEMNSNNYTFINLVTSYNPEKSRFSYRFVFNNISNQNKFTILTLEKYTSYTSTINLVPRYLLATIKYRF